MLRNGLLALVTGLTLLSVSSTAAGRVTLERTHGATTTTAGWTLNVDGRPFEIKGAGGHQYLDLLRASGGNAIRTWGVGEETPALLDRAHEAGLKVVVGIWLGHERHGFDYNNADDVAAQFDHVRDSVEKLKDHPALLAWGLGNEMEGEHGDNAAIWSHLEACAAMVKRLDPNHPTMTVIAEIGPEGIKARHIHRFCPSIDIIGINSYGGAFTLPQRYAATGATKPYVVTEFGPLGPWEVDRNGWGAAVEVPSTAKGDLYRRAYEAIHADPNSLGSFAFLWGSKQEATATWFGMFMPDGEKLEAVDVMTELWSGRTPENRCPRIDEFAILGDAEVDRRGEVRVRLAVSDPDGDDLEVFWELRHDPMEYMTGGDAQEVPPNLPEAIVSHDAKGAVLRMPDEGGKYRVFAHVHDGRGAAATANLPINVRGPKPETHAARAKLHLRLAGEGAPAGGYIPSGYMGTADAVRIDENWDRDPKAGESCWRVHYDRSTGWAGVVWQHPENDWGEVDGGFALGEAEALTFWARGERGGEKVKFGFGLLGRDKAFYDTDRAEIEVALTREWKRYRIPVADKAMDRIKTGFYWVLASDGAAVTFYLDDVMYE